VCGHECAASVSAFAKECNNTMQLIHAVVSARAGLPATSRVIHKTEQRTSRALLAPPTERTPRMTRHRQSESGTELQHYEDADEATLSRHVELGRYDEEEIATLPWLPLVDRGAPALP